MLTEWINPAYINKKTVQELHKKYKKAKPYPHLVLPHFFAVRKILQLRATLLHESFQRLDKDLFSFNTTKELRNTPAIQEFYKFFSSPTFAALLEHITGESLGPVADMHGHLFTQGDYLLYHDDLVEGRKLAYVINLSQAFTSKDGGRLCLYDVKKPQKPIVRIVPEFNSFVCFKVSSKSLHAVEEVLSNKKRLTIGGWFYGY